VAIRGISDTGSGAATTGFYLDDTPLQKRNAGGVRTGSGNGTPLPPLFDVERVEVLRGPQGTLFGAGSEGGTIRYITAQPSLDRISVYGRAEASATSRGDPSGEIGLAVGAPLVRDRLAVRIAAYRGHTGGFLDYLDPFTGAVRWPDANWGDAKMLRAAVQWAPRDDLRATVSVWSSNERWASATSAYTPSMRAAIVVPTLCFNTRGITPASPQNNPAPVPCSSPGVTYVRPAQSYGPFPDLGPGKSLLRDRTPSSTNILTPSLTLQYEGPAFTAKSITSYIDDQTRLTGIDNLSQIRDSHSSATYGDIYIPRGFTLAADYADAWRVNGHFQSLNKRYGVSQEVRLGSRRGEQRLTWVAGVFYSNLKTSQAYNNVYEGLDQLAQTLYGISAAQRYGVGPYLLNGVPSGFDHKDQTFQDVEVAAFGEADYRVAERLRLIFGLRVSRLRFDYTEHHYGPASGFNVPTPENGGGPNSGTTTESPVAPKLGAVYEIDPSNLVYLTAAKGFRAGGVNAILPAAICGPGLAQYGLQPQDVPPTYASDSVWSYELGGKFRLWRERVQLNLAAYRIDWRDAQLNIDVGNNCGIPFTGNAGTARSQGMEIEAQARLAHDLTADLAIGYDDARYTADAVAVRAGATPLVVARKDQRFAVPPWTVRLGARYDFRFGGLGGYARLDGFYTRRFQATAMQTFGLPAYAPDARSRDATRVNARLALQRDGIELALFASNIFNSSEGLLAGGRSGCALPAAGGGPACASYGTYNPFFTVTPATWPRQVGVQVVYRR
jgi:outer membrane receptor protein involved in Fe transport